MVNFTFSLHNFEYFLLILVRIASFVFVAPFFGDSAVPSRVKIGLSVFVALFMYNIVNKPDLDYTSSVGYSIIVVREVITGLLIGFAAYICNSIILFAGNIIDMDMGFIFLLSHRVTAPFSVRLCSLPKVAVMRWISRKITPIYI